MGKMPKGMDEAQKLDQGANGIVISYDGSLYFFHIQVVRKPKVSWAFFLGEGGLASWSKLGPWLASNSPNATI